MSQGVANSAGVGEQAAAAAAAARTERSGRLHVTRSSPPVLLRDHSNTVSVPLWCLWCAKGIVTFCAERISYSRTKVKVSKQSSCKTSKGLSSSKSAPHQCSEEPANRARSSAPEKQCVVVHGRCLCSCCLCYFQGRLRCRCSGISTSMPYHAFIG